MKGVTKEWAITLAFCLFTLLALGLSLTWVNIERVDMAYELKRLQTEIDSQEALISKLEVERNTLLTPERLRVLAGQYGLTQARPGQIRRLAASGEELPSPVIKGVAVVQEKAKAKPDAAREAKRGGKKARAKQGAKQAQAGNASGVSQQAPGEAGSVKKPPSAPGGKNKDRQPVPLG